MAITGQIISINASDILDGISYKFHSIHIASLEETMDL